MRGIIYGLSLDDGEIRYIGKSIDISARLRSHKHSSNKGVKTPLYHWIRKYGFDAIRVSVIEEGGVDELFDLEIKWIAHYRAQSDRILNVTTGGDGVRGYAQTEERKRAHSELMSGPNSSNRTRPMTPKMLGHLRNMSKTRKPVSAETRAKMSAAHTGRRRSPEARAAVSEGRLRSFQNDPEKLARQQDMMRNAQPKSIHVRWHANRGITKSGCNFCESL
jgi:group I intron endonuclease